MRDGYNIDGEKRNRRRMQGDNWERKVKPPTKEEVRGGGGGGGGVLQ